MILFSFKYNSCYDEVAKTFNTLKNKHQVSYNSRQQVSLRF